MSGNRLALARDAVRPSLKARLMLSGPAGAGKTYSALEIATTLGDRVLLIDTEKESALTYASEFTFTHLPWAAPFDPRELGSTLVQAASAYDVVIVDSFSHFWGGQGGTLDIADGKFGGWKTARPAQNDAIDGILSTAAHVIICVRSKIEHVQELDSRTGKQVVRKLGMAPQQDGTLEYELNLSAELDIDHRLTISKSRTTAVPVGKMYAPGHARDLAAEYRDWLAGGEPFADLTDRAALDQDIRALSDRAKAALRDAWTQNGLPRPDLLTVSQHALAASLVLAVQETPGHDDGPTLSTPEAPAEVGGGQAPTSAGRNHRGADESGPFRANPDGAPTQAQTRMMFGLLKGVDGKARPREESLAIIAGIVEREIESSSDLTKAEVSRVIDALQKAGAA